MKAKYILFLLLFFWGTRGVIAQESNKQDSIRQILQTMPDTARLPYLAEKVKETNLSASRLDYARLLYQESVDQGNDKYIADAIYLLAVHFYSLNKDSLLFWVELGEPIFIKLNRLEDISRMKTWYIYALNRSGQKNTVLQAVSELRDFADKNNFPEAYEMADQAMANFYFVNDLPEDGERLYLDVLERLKKRDAPLIKKFNIFRHLSLQASTSKKRLHYLHLAEECLEEAKNQGLRRLNAENPIYVLEYVVNRTYANEYLRTPEYQLAWDYLLKADSLSKVYDMARSEMELKGLYSEYYNRSGDHLKALVYVEDVLSHLKKTAAIHAYAERLQEKASILSKLGRFQQAYQVSEELIYLKDSINRTDFHETLANVRTEYEVERLESEKQLVEEKAKQSHRQMLFLLSGCAILLIIIIALIYMIRIIQRNRKELKIAKEKAEEADRLKSTFLANMNHEIRTPLNAIVGFSQVIVDEEDQAVREQYAEIIQSNNELLQRLIGDILDISKIESNSMSLVYSKQELTLLMKEIYNVIFMRMQPGVELILDPCEPVSMETDRNRLMQILTNLLTNAIKHTVSGYIRLGYKVSGEEITFYVEDTGEGIPQEQLISIFDRFVQLENGKKGVGLGLAISKGLVTNMNGRIWVESEPGKGATFFVRVPLTKTN